MNVERGHFIVYKNGWHGFFCEKEVEPLILCIAVYADPHFANIETFESWWNIENLALGGKKPKVLAQTKNGIEQVMQYLVQLE